MSFFAAWQVLFGFFPSWFQVFLAVAIALLVVIFVLALVQAIKNTIPFL